MSTNKQLIVFSVVIAMFMIVVALAINTSNQTPLDKLEANKKNEMNSYSGVNELAYGSRLVYALKSVDCNEDCIITIRALNKSEFDYTLNYYDFSVNDPLLEDNDLVKASYVYDEKSAALNNGEYDFRIKPEEVKEIRMVFMSFTPGESTFLNTADGAKIQILK